MNLSLADKIAQAVLYEGYILYPYRPDTFKNRQRWTFGSLFPREYSEHERWFSQFECLLAGGPLGTVDFYVRCLQLQERSVGSLLEPMAQWLEAQPPAYCQVDTLAVGERTLYGWQEAVEREAAFTGLALDSLLAGPQQFDFSFPASRTEEPVPSEAGEIVALIIRQCQALTGRLEVQARMVEPDLGGAPAVKLSVRVTNLTGLGGPPPLSRDEAARWSLASTHVLLGAPGGRFISVTDPPEPYRQLAAGCEQAGLWPVLVGQAPEADLLLASPIILYDYPEIAPESPGDLFDGCEIDEILTLRILTLTEAEKAAMREIDERSRAVLDRSEALSEEELLRLHGTLRGLRSLEQPDD